MQNILVFGGHAVSLSTPQLCHWSSEAVIDNVRNCVILAEEVKEGQPGRDRVGEGGF